MADSEPSVTESAPENQLKPVDVATILKGFGVLRGENVEDVPSEKREADAFLAIVEDPANATSCVEQLFPNGIPVDQSFYDRLDEFHRWIGIADSGDEAIGIVWSEALRRLDLAKKQQLLDVFAIQKPHDFFENLRSLSVVVKDHRFPASFLADWLASVLQAVEGDVVNDVWTTIRTLCMCHPDDAIEVLWALSTPPDSRRLRIAGYMLGTLRSLALDEKQRREFSKVESFFRDHADNPFRAVFNWSWATTAQDQGIAAEELEVLFDRASRSKEDLSNVVSVVCRMIGMASLSTELLERCHEWLNTRISCSLSPDAKYYVAWLAAWISRENGSSSGAAADVAKWVVAIQPIPQDNQGTWGRIADYLCKLLKRDLQQFGDVFRRLCETSAATICNLMSNRSFEHLIGKMHNANIGELVGRLAVSINRETRELGLYLFSTLDIAGFSEAAFCSDEVFTSRLLFYETQRAALNPKAIARILVALVPIAERSTDGFRDEVFAELKLQCQNFAGAFRGELEAVAKNLPMVTEALREVANYFTSLERVHEAGIDGMEVAGYSRAAAQQRRGLSRKMSEGVKKYSVFLSSVKHMRLLYGRQTSQFMDGQLRDAIPLRHISHSMELPMVELCAPEEMALRRFHASAAIAALVAQHQKEHHPEVVLHE